MDDYGNVLIPRHSTIKKTSTMKNKVELVPVELDAKYRKKWQATGSDFFHLYVNGKRANDSLYRVGGFGVKLDEKYFMLLKQVESKYEDRIMEMTRDFHKKNETKFDNNPRHLANCSCIVDENGVEKVVVNEFGTPYIIGGCVYTINNKYYNIETGELYCTSHSPCIKSKDFIFINNEFDDDKSKRGVLRINKHDGSTELYQI